jgi:hypothetical protein
VLPITELSKVLGSDAVSYAVQVGYCTGSLCHYRSVEQGASACTHVSSTRCIVLLNALKATRVQANAFNSTTVHPTLLATHHHHYYDRITMLHNCCRLRRRQQVTHTYLWQTSLHQLDTLIIWLCLLSAVWAAMLKCNDLKHRMMTTVRSWHRHWLTGNRHVQPVEHVF